MGQRVRTKSQITQKGEARSTILEPKILSCDKHLAIEVKLK